MDKITEEELDDLKIDSLVSRMDGFLISDDQAKAGFNILNLNVQSLHKTKAVQGLESEFQRTVVYKAFGFLLQLQYISQSLSIQPLQFGDTNQITATQLNFAALNQWCAVSSRMAFEYFMHLTYMLGEKEEFPRGGSATTKYKDWLKKPNNPYTYFALIVAQVRYFDRTRRNIEAHAETKHTRRILLMSADNINDINKNLYPYIELQNQWQYVLKIANGYCNPNEWTSVAENSNAKKWHELYKSGDCDAINMEIDRMFPREYNTEIRDELFSGV